VVYRHFDNGIEISYPFGYGLSYTDFEYRNMNVSVDSGMINISVLVENSGETAGKEVVEIFVSKPDTDIDRPVQELKAFAKTPLLNSGETAEVNMNIPISDLSYWDEDYSDWAFEKGTYVIRAASSSRDIRLSEEISL
jgi:beta-glucosidase